MLTLQQIKSNPAEVVARLAVKGFDGKEAIDRVLALDDRRRQLQLDNDNKAAELNRLSASIGALMKQGKRDEAEQAKQDAAIAAQRRSQVGSGMRNERIRTYNFPQGRVTDHRIGLTLYKIDAVMDGDLEEITGALITADQAEKLRAQGESS